MCTAFIFKMSAEVERPVLAAKRVIEFQAHCRPQADAGISPKPPFNNQATRSGAIFLNAHHGFSTSFR